MKLDKIIFCVLITVFSTACNDWLTETPPAQTDVDDYFTSGKTALATVNGAYVPLAWEYNGTFYSEWFIGDVVSDDALKGGQNLSDMASVYDMENFKTIANNDLLLEFYRAQYQGIGRCNLALQEIPQMDLDSLMTQDVQNRFIGELKFLRAMYYFRLVRVFGGVPKVDFVVASSDKWTQPRASAEDIYSFIIKDLEDANKMLWTKSEYRDRYVSDEEKKNDPDLGRVTKGAAQAMLLKTNLYIREYAEAKRWGDSIIGSAEYTLLPEYKDNFSLSGENGAESVFEIQYADDPTGDYGQGNGFTRGTFTVILTRSRSAKLGSGWGFNKPTKNLLDEFEANDPRAEVAILDPGDLIENEDQEIYLGSKYLNRKYGFYSDNLSPISLSHDTRAPLNNKVIRYADVLLMYAEACVETNDLSAAKAALNEVRARARGSEATLLPDFPDYQCNLWDDVQKKYVNRQCADNQADLRQAIRHERRVELAMEGHRWFDICRWEIAKEVMDAYKQTESEDARSHMSEFVKGKHELFPIPSKEIELNPVMEQNWGY